VSEASEKRICEYRHCDVDISDMRPNAKFCCPAHRAAEDRLRHGKWVREPRRSSDGASKPHSTDSSRRRRPNRDGSGTRLYVVRDDLDEVRRLLAGEKPRPEAAERLQAKVGAALGRLG
jgi:hypothetical protein